MPVMRSIGAGVIAGAVLLASTRARAEGPADLAHAKEAYDRAVAAHERGDFARAAREFAAADGLAPSNVALQAGLDAAVDADDPAALGELLERSKRVAPPIPVKLAQSIEAARKKLRGRAGRIRVTCPVTCTATVDGKPFDTKSPIWIVTGPHTVVVQLDGETRSSGVDVRTDEIVDVAPTRKATSPLPPPVPPPAPPPPPRTTPQPDDTASSSGLSPVVFFIGVGATLLAGGAATYFMVTTRGKHADFVAANCDVGPAAPCDALKKDGESAQVAANVTLGVSALLAVGTVIVGAAFTSWGGGPKKAALRLPGPPGSGLGSGATYSVRF